MMGDEGSSGKTGLHPSFGQAVPILSNPSPSLHPVDRDRDGSSSQEGQKEWSSQPCKVSSGLPLAHSGWSEVEIEEWFDLMAGASLGEGGLPEGLSGGMLTFPEGGEDAVTITASDYVGLEPGRFVSDNIIDFYTKYLNLHMLSFESRKRFHFFNSFFFTMLLAKTNVTDTDACKVDYEQLRKWSGEVNLFEKDYVFIPVIKSFDLKPLGECNVECDDGEEGELQDICLEKWGHLTLSCSGGYLWNDRSHWSLIIICHLSSLNSSSPEKRKGWPCILHLDSMEGTHESFEREVRSCILQAWLKRFQALKNVDLLHSLVQMKYIQAKVPQQDNGYDCGLYLLHYIEVFLAKSTSRNICLASSDAGAHFTSIDFRKEVCDKRVHIQNLIHALSRKSDDGAAKQTNVQPMPRQKALGVHGSRRRGLPKPGKEIKSKKWNGTETSILLQCMVDGGPYWKGSQGAMDWELISQKINDSKRNNGPTRSKEQCQNRFDTLLKAYKVLNAHCLKSGKKFIEITDEEKRELKLATPLDKKDGEWYDLLNIINDRRLSHTAKSVKRVKLSPDSGNRENGRFSASQCSASIHNPAPSNPIAGCELRRSSPKQVVIPRIESLNEELRSTLLNLIQACSIPEWWHREDLFIIDNRTKVCNLKVVCRRLAIVQDQDPLVICKHVLMLSKLKLVNVTHGYPEEVDKNEPLGWVQEVVVKSDLQVYKKFAKKVLCRNPFLKTFQRLSNRDSSLIELCSLQEIRLLSLYKCENIEHLDLKNFPKLRYLDIISCDYLNMITGWEDVPQLGWLEMGRCKSYYDFPNIQCLSSLKEFSIRDIDFPVVHWFTGDFEQYVQLRRVEIMCNRICESMDLKPLKLLGKLSFERCYALSAIHGLSELHTLTDLDLTFCQNLSTIQGLNGLHCLTRLEFGWCDTLRTIPELHCLKALTYLMLGGSGVEQIPGVEELHLLASLILFECESLTWLPFLGHLKSLVYLKLDYSGVEEIPGIEGLVSLETLDCRYSCLKRLPALHHLPRLQTVKVLGTPLSEDPTSIYHELDSVSYNCKVERMRSVDGDEELWFKRREDWPVFVGRMSDMSDAKYTSSDED